MENKSGGINNEYLHLVDIESLPLNKSPEPEGFTAESY
jgi:hypothetical protein